VRGLSSALRPVGAYLNEMLAGICQTILDQGPAIGTLLMRFQEDAERTGLFRELLPYIGSLIARWNDRY
jgi:hypothetical protein